MWQGNLRKGLRLHNPTSDGPSMQSQPEYWTECCSASHWLIAGFRPGDHTIRMRRTKVETEVRFVWLTNREADVLKVTCSRKGSPLSDLSKPSVDLSMVITRHTPSIGLCHIDGKERLMSSRLVAKSDQQFAGFGADNRSGISAKSGYLSKNGVTITQKTVTRKGTQAASVFRLLKDR